MFLIREISVRDDVIKTIPSALFEECVIWNNKMQIEYYNPP